MIDTKTSNSDNGKKVIQKVSQKICSGLRKEINVNPVQDAIIVQLKVMVVLIHQVN